jgi:glycosyltransferase involved in cell wall biosynthesis
MSKKQHRAPARPSQRPDVALVVIARNEARCIARCLRSARGAVSRMLVLDPGSTDDTPAIAAACGAQVHHATWSDDFSMARNTALELAQADWNLILDADEWIESGAQAPAPDGWPSPSWAWR